jgi:hypothetical protein
MKQLCDSNQARVRERMTRHPFTSREFSCRVQNVCREQRNGSS